MNHKETDELLPQLTPPPKTPVVQVRASGQLLFFVHIPQHEFFFFKMINLFENVKLYINLSYTNTIRRSS